HIIKECIKTNQVIVYSVFIGGVFVLANVSAYQYSSASFWVLLQSLHCRFHSSIVEPHPVYDGRIFLQTEQARGSISNLRFGRHRSDFDKSDTQIRKFFVQLGILVESSSQTHRIWKFQAKEFTLQLWILTF